MTIIKHFALNALYYTLALLLLLCVCVEMPFRRTISALSRELQQKR